MEISVSGRPIIHPPSQTVNAYEGESLDVIVEFCAEPSYTKVLWMSEKYVYIPGSETRDGVQALTIEVNLPAPVALETWLLQHVLFLSLHQPTYLLLFTVQAMLFTNLHFTRTELIIERFRNDLTLILLL